MRYVNKLAVAILVLSFQPALADRDSVSVIRGKTLAIADVLGSETAQTLEEMLMHFPVATELGIGGDAMVWDVRTGTGITKRVRDAVTRHGRVAEFQGWLTSYLEGYAFLYTNEKGKTILDVTIRWDNGDPAERVEWTVRPILDAKAPVVSGLRAGPDAQQFEIVPEAILKCKCGKKGGTCDEEEGDCDYLESCGKVQGGICAYRQN